MIRCKARIWVGHHQRPCSKSATIGDYCHVHDPDKKKGRQAASQQRFDVQWEAKQAIWRKQEARNRSQPLLLEALKRVMAEIPSSRDWLDPITEQMAREAIKSAEVESL